MARSPWAPGRALAVLSMSALWLAPTARADEAVFPTALLGSWHVLIHYRDAGAAHPEQWHWEDRVWELRSDGDRVVWSEHLLVRFVDESGRFTDLGTNRAARVAGAWQPNERQAVQIASGLQVVGRTHRSRTLARAPDGAWRTPEGSGALSGLTGDSVYTSSWSVEPRPDRLALVQVDEVRSATGVERLGETVYTLERRASPPRGSGIWTGEYARDATRRGRVFLRPTKIASGVHAVLDDRGHVSMSRHGVVKPGNGILWSLIRPAHYFGERLVRIETVPPDAVLDLAYLRRGTQLQATRTRAPATVRLPTRVAATPADTLRVRAQAPGHRRESRSVIVQSGIDALTIELPPLPNRLVSLRTGSLGGRSRITLATELEPTVRTRRTRGDYTAVLLSTGLAEDVAERVAALATRHVAGVRATQVGEDLVLVFELSDEARERGVEIRVLSSHDAARDRVISILDWSVPEDREHWATDLLRAFDANDTSRLDACDEQYARALRRAVAGDEWLRIEETDSDWLRPVRREALRRVGRRSEGGRVRLGDGSTLDPGDPLELELALASAERIPGFAPVLRDFVDALEPAERRPDALRTLVAPRLSAPEFQRAAGTALEAERTCRGRDAPPPGQSRSALPKRP